MKRVVSVRFRDKEFYSELRDESVIVFGSHKKDTINMPDAPDHFITFKMVGIDVRIKVLGSGYSNTIINTNELVYINTDYGEISLYVSIVSGKSTQNVTLPYSGVFTVGRRSDNDIILGYPIVSGLHFKMSIENNAVHVEDMDSTNGLYLNGRKISKAVMKTDDVLSIYTFRFILKDGTLSFENMGAALHFSDRIKNNLENNLDEIVQSSVKNDDSKYLIYHLSPRIREKMPDQDIILSPVPEEAKASGGSKGNFAYLVGSGAMMAASLATGIVSPAMLLARSAGMISPIANMAMYGKLSKEEKKQLEEYEKLRQEKYQAYISDQKAKITKIANIQRKILTEENRSPSDLIDSVNKLNRNIWERMSTDSDFLVTRLGLGSIKLCVDVKTRAQEMDFKMAEDDDLAILAESIIEETRLVDNAPVCVPLNSVQTMGIVGPEDKTVYLLRSMFIEIATQHNYSDVKLVFISDRSSLGRWGILRWLPHIWDETKQVRYISFDDESKHTICELLEEIIKKRKYAASDTSGHEVPSVLPHYIVVVENRELICNETIYDDLTSNNPAIGMTTIVLSKDLYELPQKCQFIVDLQDRPYAYFREHLNEKCNFELDAPIHQTEMDGYTRRLSAIELEGLRGEDGIPNSITFLQGFGANSVKDLDIYGRWENSEPYRTLAAPIGMMNGGKIFALDVMSGEGAHGPHGLLAGTTGSGKSELLQTWILSMAINYHPHDVNFVIIDYKGGGMSDLMEPLPHVVGKITNIDRNIKRSLVALKSELKRRQELFAKVGVNNIGKYQKAYKNGEVEEPLPHLILVTDEFAEMKKEEPEFMTELNSVATVGRSLGIHMLLATQKPAGVVTDQINSNSRFRICMKVQDVSDSREMLKRPDAAKITQSGRAYFRIGEDEDFGLFQSFYSGAEYIENKQAVAANENQIRIVGVTGNRINPIVKKAVKNNDQKEELTAVIEEIRNICELHGIKKMPGPWLPELPKWLPLASIGIDTSGENIRYKNINDGIVVPVGMFDIPAHQKQGVQLFNLSEMGHCGVYGMPGSGKTTFLKTLLTSIGFSYSKEDISVYVIDAVSGIMTEYRQMPHIKDVIRNIDQNAVETFIRRIKGKIDRRRELFIKYAVNSLSAFRTSVSSDMPAILIAVDGIAQMFEENMMFEELMTEIASTGSTYGIHIVFTANSTIGIKYKFLQLIKGGIALQLPDKGDYLTVVGQVANVSLPAFPGRALLKGNPPVEIQLAVYSDKADEKERSEDVKQILRNMENVNASSENDDEANVQEIQNETTVSSRSIISVGNDVRTFDSVEIDLTDDYLLLISRDDVSKGVAVLKTIEQMLGNNPENQVIHITKDNCSETLTKLVGLLNDRKKQKKQQVWTADHTESDWLSEYMQLCLIIDDVDSLLESADEKNIKTLRRIITLSGGLGVIVVASCGIDLLNDSDNDVLCSALAEAKNVIGIGSEISDNRYIKSISDEMRWLGVDKDEAFVISNGRVQVIEAAEEES